MDIASRDGDKAPWLLSEESMNL